MKRELPASASDTDGRAPDDAAWEEYPVVLQALSRAIATSKTSVDVVGPLERLRAARDQRITLGKGASRHHATVGGWRLDRGMPGSGKQHLQKVATWSGVAIVAVVTAVAVAYRHVNDTTSSTPGAERRYTTQDGERATLQLGDGTRVELAPRSVLTVSREFGTTDRSVVLTGEGRFTVSRAAGIPFVVQTGEVATRVLGTKFAVRKRVTDAETWIMVTSGKVVATGRRASVVVSGGEMARATDSTALLTPPTGPGTYTDWEHGRLVFNTVPIPDMLAAIGTWYGYQFQLSDSLLMRQKVTAAFRVDDASDMLVAIERILDVTVRMTGKTVV
jgi:transmembrane sensor